MECQCENNAEAASAGWFLSGSNVQMGSFAVVGYLLYRFSQTLPALIRWPIRFFCYITGLSALWGWVSRLVGTIRGIKNFLKWFSRIGRFLVGSSGDGDRSLISGTSERSDLRLILLGPSGGGRTFIVDTLLGNNRTKASMDPVNHSTKWSIVVDGREITVVDTPDILGSSLGNTGRAREALRSLQLTSPGPHAFLLVIQTPGSSMSHNQDLTQAIQGTLELFGDGVREYVLPVLTNADCGRRRTEVQRLEADSSELKKALSLCVQTPELVDNRPDLPPEAQTDLCRNFVERVTEMKECKGHFVHEVQKEEDALKEKLLDDMSLALAKKLCRM